MTRSKMNLMNTLREYFLLTVSTLILVVGVYLFKFPNNFSFGGVTGIAAGFKCRSARHSRKSDLYYQYAASSPLALFFWGRMPVLKLSTSVF